MQIRSVRFLVIVSWPLIAACGEDPAAEVREVPAGLSAVESGAEDAYDMALAGDNAAVARTAETLSHSWGHYRSQALQDGASEALAAQVDDAIAGLHDAANQQGIEHVSLARAANMISAPMDELYALYQPTVPADVLALDYLGREVALDGMDGDPGAADADITEIEARWATLRPEVVEAGGSKEAADFDASIDGERGAVLAGDAQGLVDTANVQLELVDALENVFDAAGEDPAD